MNIEKYELEDTELLVLAEKSYITKEKLIEFINALDFERVKDFSMQVITGYRIRINNEGKKYVDTLGYDIRID